MSKRGLRGPSSFHGRLRFEEELGCRRRRGRDQISSPDASCGLPHTAHLPQNPFHLPLANFPPPFFKYFHRRDHPSFRPRGFHFSNRRRPISQHGAPGIVAALLLAPPLPVLFTVPTPPEISTESDRLPPPPPPLLRIFRTAIILSSTLQIFN